MTTPDQIRLEAGNIGDTLGRIKSFMAAANDAATSIQGEYAKLDATMEGGAANSAQAFQQTQLRIREEAEDLVRSVDVEVNRLLGDSQSTDDKFRQILGNG